MRNCITHFSCMCDLHIASFLSNPYWHGGMRCSGWRLRGSVSCIFRVAISKICERGQEGQNPLIFEHEVRKFQRISVWNPGDLKNFNPVLQNVTPHGRSRLPSKIGKIWGNPDGWQAYSIQRIAYIDAAMAWRMEDECPFPLPLRQLCSFVSSTRLIVWVSNWAIRLWWTATTLMVRSAPLLGLNDNCES